MFDAASANAPIDVHRTRRFTVIECGGCKLMQPR